MPCPYALRKLLYTATTPPVAWFRAIVPKTVAFRFATRHRLLLWGATKCITQRDYQIRHCLIVLALCQSKEYAAIRFHRRGLLSPVSLQYQQTDFNLLGRANVCGPGYSFAFWLKNLQTQNDVFASASSGEHSFCTRIFKPKGEHPSYASHAL